MARKYSPEQIIRILKEQEEGKSYTMICREYNIARSTLYKWGLKYGGMGESEARKLKALEEENNRLKRLVAELSMDKQVLQEICSKKY